MNILIIEDEAPAAKRLEKLVLELAPLASIQGRLDTIKRAVAYLQTQPPIDLVFCDIQLADGLSFEIFKQVSLDCPLIFTTAFDQYAIQAFKVNAIDYLLKPIDPQELATALDKYHKLQLKPTMDFSHLQQLIQQSQKTYKSRFMVKVGEKISAIQLTDIQYFFSEERITFAVTSSGKRFILDYTLEQLENQLNPDDFFRLNRKYLASIASVEEIISYSNSRLKIKLKDCSDQDILVSRERVMEFKTWLDS
ncbi:LytR/AlgR family response regulator transcription factor [Mongoliitalea daihaiensis]|uniref:LytR/AlgR family response regulator transcription factor n=1 Tax=Mongoliitalea daihaiensis TaxID=2782006 RepID=UPI001F485FCB|nr:LytTR family DNA-binding domain-containing protein [Mongoliitalea daihaiensis]UJP65111.1 response regulator transcription factor [Mongoliitalea daihaiensis]